MKHILEAIRMFSDTPTLSVSLWYQRFRHDLSFCSLFDIQSQRFRHDLSLKTDTPNLSFSLWYETERDDPRSHIVTCLLKLWSTHVVIHSQVVIHSHVVIHFEVKSGSKGKFWTFFANLVIHFGQKMPKNAKWITTWEWITTMTCLSKIN